MAPSTHKDLVGRLLKSAGTTYAEEAGIRLRDAPMALLVLCMLASKPIDATIAMQATKTAKLAAELVRVSMDDDIRARLVA